MFDDAEILTALPHPRWPLHPAPRPFERLDGYVRRLAECYGIGLATFCRHGLGDAGDVGSLADGPPRRALERLSAGTGVPVRHLRNMTTRRCHARLMIEVRRLVREHPEIVHQGSGEVPGQLTFLDGI